MCIECGYCEPVCPSRELTLTPRQRIVVRREMVRQEASAEPLSDAAEPVARLPLLRTGDLCRRRDVPDPLPGLHRHRSPHQASARPPPFPRLALDCPDRRPSCRPGGAGGAGSGRHRPWHGRGAGDPGHAGHHRRRSRSGGDGVVPPVERGRAASRPAVASDLGRRRAGRLFPGLHGADVRAHRRRTGSAQRARGPGRPGAEGLGPGPHPRGHQRHLLQHALALEGFRRGGCGDGQPHPGPPLAVERWRSLAGGGGGQLLHPGHSHLPTPARLPSDRNSSRPCGSWTRWTSSTTSFCPGWC